VNVLDRRVKLFRKQVLSFEEPFTSYHCNLLVGGLGFHVLDSVLKPVAGIELSKEVFTSRAR
jgi:hypothetical protein